jgi:hypothetical protein
MEWAVLPVDLGRWDQAPGGDLIAVAVWSDVRPLRGAAGLCDWRLCGALSQRLREQHFAAERGEKLLVPTRRLPWRSVLAVGLGEAARFSEDGYLAGLETTFETMAGLGLTTLALALPGRDLDLIAPERAAVLLRAAIASHERISEVTIMDTSAALKAISAELGLRPARLKSAAK